MAEVAKDGTLKPYPDEKWNSWRNAEADEDARRPSISSACSRWWPTVTAISGCSIPAAPGNEKVIAGAAKLVRIELATNKVAQVIKFGEDVALQGSYLNDVRFSLDGHTAFITDSGARGSIVIVDLESGKARSALDGHPSTQPTRRSR